MQWIVSKRRRYAAERARLPHAVGYHRGSAAGAARGSMAYRRVAALADIPQGRGLRVCVGSLEIGLFRVEDAVYALENPCPHRESPLSDGELNGCVITCPAHGWEFDVRTGFRPEDPDGWPIPRFAVRVAAGEVWLDPEDVINRRPRARRG